MPDQPSSTPAPPIQHLRTLGVVLALACVPLLVSGPGNDLDVGNTFRAGRSLIGAGRYEPSRAPGAPVHEALVGILDRIGGPLLTNLLSLVSAVVLALLLERLLRNEGVPTGGRWALAVLVANPWFLIAATDTTEYLLALALVVGCALAVRSQRPVPAGILAALAMGCRIGSGLLVAAILLAELTEPTAPDPDDDAPRHPEGATGRRRRVVVTLAVAAAGTLLLFVPAYRSAGGLSFVRNDFSSPGLTVQAGRALVKDLTLLGVFGSIALLAAVPDLFRSRHAWRTSWLLRFALVGFVGSQVLFIRFPWKMPHLLPCLVTLVIALAVALAKRPRLLVAMTVLQLLFCVVQLEVVQPNRENRATEARFSPHLTWGPLVTDLRCRRKDPDAYEGRQRVEIERVWNCSTPFGR